MKILLSTMLFSLAMLTGMSAQKNATTFKALKIDSETSKTLSKIETEEYSLRGNILTPAKGMKIIYDKKSESFVVTEIENDINDKPALGQDDSTEIAPGVYFRCSGNCDGNAGCKTTFAESPAGSKLWKCTKCEHPTAQCWQLYGFEQKR